MTGNACKEEGSRGSVMAPMVAATFHHFYWSACSKKEFHRRVRWVDGYFTLEYILELYLKVNICRRWSCLLNKPRHDSLGQLRTTVRETFTMDEQCRMEFGEGWVLFYYTLLYINNDTFHHLWYSEIFKFFNFTFKFAQTSIICIFWTKSYEHCKTFDIEEPCSRLWCGNSNISESCKTKKGPPLEGTLCGTSKVNF